MYTKSSNDNIYDCQELRKAASEKKIKYYYKLSKVELVKALNLDETIVCKPSKAKEVLITYFPSNSKVEGGEAKKLMCKSMYQCSKLLNKKIGSMQHYLRTGTPLKDKDGNEITLAFA